MVQSVCVRERKIRIHGPDGLADFVEEAFRAGARAADRKRERTGGPVSFALETDHQEGAIDPIGWIPVHAVVMDIRHDSYDFAPVVYGADTNALSDGFCGIAPIF